ncbi:concanavalin A-like lectin/glucanase domain-containing protein [Amylocarpus encephaloides]|uniref:Concanavalin A-like lectin/glucanase domain-containing protein n=1 Tax=Amylocarpus encephaloides TaxID=45428 RepID=A0A9P8C8B9_9HELO|nr:concanavalin A-like lectin/glucanase domain-containing protein [Amylocarpus encephaloides]
MFFAISVSALLFSAAHATYLNNELSFGHNGKISPNLRAVPNFHLIGDPHPPEILSNKLVLTPPVPGRQRGAVWAETPLHHSSWTVDVDFRATGPERGGGNFNIWYARNGQKDIATSSIYTVGRWDGLALVIDQYAGSGGFIRGFLNDGQTDYKSHHSVDSLAFGHCEYSYRNLGRPSRIMIQHTAETFKVSVDGHDCFKSSRIKLPIGNFFGLSAASAENPDSFEVFKFVTTTDTHSPDPAGEQANPNGMNYGAAHTNEQQEKKELPNQENGNIPSYSNDDIPASKFHSSAEQFADLHNRLQSMMKHITYQSRMFDEYQRESTRRYEVLANKIDGIEASIKLQEGAPNIMKDIHSDVRATKADLHAALNIHASGIKEAVRDTHSNVVGTLAKSSHGIGKFFLVVVASNVVVGGLYVLYKRRLRNGPKKYL